MESKDYANILDAMPKIGVYVIRRTDHRILYFNRRVGDVSPEVRLGIPCHRIWADTCVSCPLQSIEGKRESRSISYNEAFGGVVDLVAAEIDWEEATPAYLITVIPRVDTVGYTYRTVLLVDLDNDRCEVLKSDKSGAQFYTSGESFSSQVSRLIAGGTIHPDDAERVAAFARLPQLYASLGSGREVLTCIYRRGGLDGWRWNLLEVAPSFVSVLGIHTAILCIKDMDEVLRDGLELEDISSRRRDRQMAAILRSRYNMMTTVFLDSGMCERMSLDEAVSLQHTKIGDYAHYIQHALEDFVHPEDVPHCRDLLSLEHLRATAQITEGYHEELCEYRTKSTPVRWLEQHVIYVRREDGVSVNILGQDITQEKSQEEARLRALRDRADIIGGLSNLFFSIYYVDLASNTFRTVTQLGRVGDVLGDEVNCTAAMQIYANNFIHPDDRERYLRMMNIQNWQESLRWWHPSVELEYRRMPEYPESDPESYTWVRAAAVLARTGPDDLPQTVVYVAQDITGSRRERGNAEPEPVV